MGMQDRVLSSKPSPWRGWGLPARALEIEAIHKGSIAEAAGLKPGLIYVVKQNRKLPVDVVTLAAHFVAGTTKSIFIDPLARTKTVVTTKGFPWGMELKKPRHTLLAAARLGRITPADLAEAVLDPSDEVSSQMLAAAHHGVMRISPLSPFMAMATRLFGGKKRMHIARQPQFAAAAAAAAKRGDAKAARHLMPPLTEALLHQMGTTVGALCLFCETEVARAEGKPSQDRANLLRQANLFSPSNQRIAKALTAEGAPTVVVTEATVVRPFAVRYNLAAADVFDGPVDAQRLADSRSVDLTKSLAGLGAGQLAAVVMLSSYRTNGPYAQLMLTLGHLYPVLADRIGFVHILSGSSAIKNVQVVTRFRSGELYAKKRKVPLTVLFDEHEWVSDKLGLQVSPVLFLLDKEGTILFQGCDASDAPYWEALGRLDAGVRA